MDNESEIFEHLTHESDIAKSRQMVVSYMKSLLPLFETLSSDTYNAAYELAGLMATDYARRLNSDDPIDEILTIAGELEINPPNSESLAREISEKIKHLS